LSRKAPSISCNEEERATLEALSRSGVAEARLSKRAKIVLCCIEGMKVKDVASKFDANPNAVINIRRRFESDRIAGLYDRKRSGKPVTYGKDFREEVLKKVGEEPPDGCASWDGALLAKELDASPHAIWRLLKKEGISLKRQRSWCVSTDPEFASKAANIVGLYLNPPENAIVISVDEKPSMQALERKTGFIQTRDGKTMRAYKSTYKRHGTLNLFAALEVASGQIHGRVTDYKKRPDFIEFMNEVVAEYDNDTELHVILDNYCIHKQNDAWLADHPNVHFHFTPTSASWLNQVEIWFGIFSRKVLRGGSFEGKIALKTAVEKYISAYEKNAKPFVWKKREVRGSQIKDTIINLCD